MLAVRKIGSRENSFWTQQKSLSSVKADRELEKQRQDIQTCLESVRQTIRVKEELKQELKRGIVGAEQLSLRPRVQKIAVLDHLVNNCEDLIASTETIKPELREMDTYIKKLDDVLRPEIKKKGFHVLNVSKKLNMNSFVVAKRKMADRLRVTQQLERQKQEEIAFIADALTNSPTLNKLI